jgi:hypothetical protein
MSNIQKSMRNTLALLETVESGGGSYLLEGGVKQIDADLRDLSDTEFLKHYKKTKAEVKKEFPDAKKNEPVKEGISNSNEDPNLHKAYMMGARAYKAYKNNPEQAQAAQDRIEAEFPQYLKMWTRGYRDSERFDKQEAIKESEINEERTEEKDKEGNIVRWKEESEWKKSSGKDPKGKIANMSDKARRETDRIKSRKK